MPLTLLRPSLAALSAYEAALVAGYGPSRTRPELREEELASLRADPAAFLAGLEDPEGAGPPVTLPDGTEAPRLPLIVRWMWDGEILGTLGLRWQPGTPDLPPHVLGHVGYSVVPWRRRQGHATAALALLLPEAAARGLPWVDLVTEPDNLGSRKVIEANGGRLLATFVTPPAFGAREALRYRIAL